MNKQSNYKQAHESECPELRSRRLGICPKTPSLRTRNELLILVSRRYTNARLLALVLAQASWRIVKTLQMEFDSLLLLQLRAEWLGNVASRIIYQGMPGRLQAKLHAPRVHHCPRVVHSVAFPCAGSILPIVFLVCFILAHTLCLDQKPSLCFDQKPNHDFYWEWRTSQIPPCSPPSRATLSRAMAWISGNNLIFFGDSSFRFALTLRGFVLVHF